MPCKWRRNPGADYFLIAVASVPVSPLYTESKGLRAQFYYGFIRVQVMRAFYSWITRRSARKPGPVLRPMDALHPVTVEAFADKPNPSDTLAGQEGQLLGWLFRTDSVMEQPLSPAGNAVIRELGRRIESASLVELPRQPGSLPRLMQALTDDTLDRPRLAAIILSDPTLTDHLLRVANSSYFRAGGHKVESVDQAIFLLGIDGVRGLASAAVLRPVLTARNGKEALFAKRVWRWGLACGRAVELIARSHKPEANAYFLLGLLPALVYMTLCREVQCIHRLQGGAGDAPLAVIRAALEKYRWPAAQTLADLWSLPPRFQAHLVAAGALFPEPPGAPFTGGLILGTHAVLLQAGRPTLTEASLQDALNLRGSRFVLITRTLQSMLQGDGAQ